MEYWAPEEVYSADLRQRMQEDLRLRDFPLITRREELPRGRVWRRGGRESR